MKKLYKNNKNQDSKRFLMWSACLSLGMMLVSAEALAADLGQVASNIVNTFTSITNLITSASYVGGLGFAIGSILKFKQHKDNPTQIPIGTPIALLLVAAALLFLPSILSVAGETLFGATGGTVAGPTGTIFE